MVSIRSVIRYLCALCFGTAAFAQAVAEYAAQSAASSSAGAGSGFSLGACRVDSTLVSCVSYHYPLAFQAVILAVCVFVGTLMLPKGRRV